MAALLEQVSSGEFVPEDGHTAGRAASPGRAGANASVDAVMTRLMELYDEEFGGFGLEPKQPPWEALQFLTARYGLTGDRAILGMVETTPPGNVARHLRPEGPGVLPLRGKPGLEGAALREDAGSATPAWQ